MPLTAHALPAALRALRFTYVSQQLPDVRAVTLFASGSGLTASGIGLMGVGATLAAVTASGPLGFAIMAVGGLALLIGFSFLAIGFRAHNAKQLMLQAAAETRESELDARYARLEARDQERLEIERDTRNMARESHAARNAVRNADTSDALAAATASAERAMASELGSLKNVLLKQEIARQDASRFDEPAFYRLNLEIEASKERMAEVERALAALRSEMPDKGQRQREALEGFNQVARGI